MTLQQLADQTDAREFQRLYHSPTVHTSEIADRFGIKVTRLSEFAHLLGIPTRREAGVMWTPTLLRVKGKDEPKKLGPCNPACPMWRRCKDGRLWVDVLPCEEVLDWENGIEFERDSFPTMGRVPMVARVAVEAMS